MIVMVYFRANVRIIVAARQANKLVSITPFALKLAFVFVDIINFILNR